MMIKSKGIISFSILIVIILLIAIAPFILIYLSDEYAQRLVDSIIIENIVKHEASEGTDAERLIRLQDWLHEHMIKPADYKITKRSLNELLQISVSACDQQSDLLLALGTNAGFQGRLLFLTNGQYSHMVTEFLIDGQYVVFDPLYNYVFLDKDGSYLSSLEIPELDFKAQIPQVKAMYCFNPDELDQYLNFYLKIDDSLNEKLDSDLLKQPSLFEISFRILNAIGRASYELQLLSLAMNKLDYNDLQRGRVFHLNYKWDMAAEHYTKAHDDNIPDAGYYLALLNYEQGKLSLADAELNSFMKDSEEHYLFDAAIELKGLVSLESGDTLVALKYFDRLKHDPISYCPEHFFLLNQCKDTE